MNKKEEIKNRIDLINRGEVPEGYKKVHGYIIPKDWQESPLIDMCTKRQEKAGCKKLETLSISAGIGFVNQAEKFGRELSGEQYKNYTVIRTGDFSYNKGNSKKYPQGCIYLLKDREIAAVPNVFNTFRLYDFYNNEYYMFLFCSGYLNKQLFKWINFGVRNDGLLNLYDEDFYKSILPIPSQQEQEKIAKILNCCDKVIELKQKLIEEELKKRKYYMTKLLFPKNSWSKCSVENFGTIVTGNTPSTEKLEYYGEKYSWITPSDIGFSKNIYTGERGLSEIGFSKVRKLLPGSILITCIASIGKNAILEKIGSCNQQINAIIPNTNMDSNFIYYLFENNIAILKKHAGTSATTIINKDTFSNLIFKIPKKKEEQSKIGYALSKQDNKLELLQQELEQYKQLKKALSQLLLTGIVRTVEADCEN